MKKEEDFYKPIKEYFENQGYSVKAEVKDCDCVCIKDDILVICEFKMHFNLSLLYQAMDRQSVTDYVYLCVPRYKGRVQYKNHLKARNLVKRLGLGLILVSNDEKMQVEEVVSPSDFYVRKNSRKKQSLLKEYNGRVFDLNVGGQTRKKINTAFKETNIHLLCIMEKEEQISVKELTKNYGFDKSVYGIMYRNVLGFYEKLGKGYFKMSNIGKKALESDENEKMVSFFREKIQKF